MLSPEQVRASATDHSLVGEIDFVRNGYLRIETCIKYPDGDSIDVFLSEQKDAQFPLLLSDLGQTTAWLLTLDLKPFNSQKRKAIVDDILRMYGVRIANNALELPIRRLEDLASSIVLLAQACLRVSDLMFTRRSTTQTSFSERVEEFFSEAALDYESAVDVIGKGGEPVRVDYLVRGAHNASYVQTLTATSSHYAKQTAADVFTRWYKIRGRAENLGHQRVTLLDDVQGQDVFKKDDLDLLSEVSSVFPFSNPPGIRDFLSA